MAAFHFELVSPEKLLFSGEVEAVVVPGTEGEFTVLKDHAPVISSMRPGIVVIDEAAAASQRLYVRGGFAEVAPSGLTILARFGLIGAWLFPQRAVWSPLRKEKRYARPNHPSYIARR